MLTLYLSAAVSAAFARRARFGFWRKPARLLNMCRSSRPAARQIRLRR